MNECAKAIRILAGAIVLAALILVFGTENAYESCVSLIEERDNRDGRGKGHLLCAPGLAR